MDINRYTVAISKKPGLEKEISDAEIRKIAVTVRESLENSDFNLTGSYDKRESVTFYVERFGDNHPDIADLRKLVKTGVRPKKKMVTLEITPFQPT